MPLETQSFLVGCGGLENGRGGVNDKVMVVPRARLEDALSSVFDVIMRVQAGDDERVQKIASQPDVKNAETLLAATLKYKDVPVIKLGTKDQSDELPFVDGRCSGTRREQGGMVKEWCLVSECKDCRPRGAWTAQVPTCNATECAQSGPIDN